MYNTFPVQVTVESLLPINNGKVVKCEVDLQESAFALIQKICYKMNIPFRPHFFLRADNHKVLHGHENLQKTLGSAGGAHHHDLKLDTHYVSRLRWYAVICGILLSISALAVTSSLYTQTRTESVPVWNYGIVADAGSSHTSFVLYNWPENHMEAVSQMGECTVNDGGIDIFVSNPVGVKAYVRKCLDAMANDLTVLGVTDLSSARLYLGATAGMRLASLDNPENASLIMEYIEEAFKESQFFYSPGDAKILTGQEEGAFSWITTNILAGSFQENPTDGVSYGSLDMGGASMQIAYECPEGTCENSLTFNLYNQTYEVFARSDLCYGLNEAMKRYVVVLIYEAFLENGRNITDSLSNRCLPKGNQLRDDWLVIFPAKVKDIFDSPCTTQLADSEFASLITQLPGDFEFSHRRSGTSSSDCDDAVEIFVDAEKCSALFGDENCFNFEPQRNNMPELPAYYAMSSYYWEFFRYLNTSSSNVTYDFARKRIDELCSGSFDPGSETFYNDTDCFEASYIFNIITKGYKRFDNTNFNTIFFALDIQGTEVSWALGFLVNQVNHASKTKLVTSRFISTELFSCLLIFGIFLFVISCFALKVFLTRYYNFKSMMSHTKS